MFLWRNRHLEHAIPLVAKQIVCFLDLFQAKPVCDQRLQIDPASSDHRHQPPHAPERAASLTADGYMSLLWRCPSRGGVRDFG